MPRWATKGEKNHQFFFFWFFFLEIPRKNLVFDLFTVKLCIITRNLPARKLLESHPESGSGNYLEGTGNSGLRCLWPTDPHSLRLWCQSDRFRPLVRPWRKASYSPAFTFPPTSPGGSVEAPTVGWSRNRRYSEIWVRFKVFFCKNLKPDSDLRFKSESDLLFRAPQGGI